MFLRLKFWASGFCWRTLYLVYIKTKENVKPKLGTCGYFDIYCELYFLQVG